MSVDDGHTAALALNSLDQPVIAAASDSLVRWRLAIPFETQAMKIIVIAIALLVAACKPVSTPYVGPDPADPSISVPPARYQSTLGGYVRQRPVEPAPWREQNERVAPQPKQ